MGTEKINFLSENRLTWQFSAPPRLGEVREVLLVDVEHHLLAIFPPLGWTLDHATAAVQIWQKNATLAMQAAFSPR